MQKKIKKSDKLIPLVNKEIGNIILIQKYLITRYIFEKIFLVFVITILVLSYSFIQLYVKLYNFFCFKLLFNFVILNFICQHKLNVNLKEFLEKNFYFYLKLKSSEANEYLLV